MRTFVALALAATVGAAVTVGVVSIAHAAPVTVEITESALPERLCLVRERCANGWCAGVAELVADAPAGSGLPSLRWRETWRVPVSVAGALLASVQVVNDTQRPSVLPQSRPPQPVDAGVP